MSDHYEARYTIRGVDYGIHHIDDCFKAHEYGYKAYRSKGHNAMYPVRRTKKEAEKDLENMMKYVASQRKYVVDYEGIIFALCIILIPLGLFWLLSFMGMFG